MCSVMVLNFFLFFPSSSFFREDWDALQVEGVSKSGRASVLWELLSVWQRRGMSFWRKLLQPELYSAYQRQVGFCSIPSAEWVLESMVMALWPLSPFHALSFFHDVSCRNTWISISLLNLVTSVMSDQSFIACVLPAIQLLPLSLAICLHKFDCFSAQSI